MGKTTINKLRNFIMILASQIYKNIAEFFCDELFWTQFCLKIK